MNLLPFPTKVEHYYFDEAFLLEQSREHSMHEQHIHWAYALATVSLLIIIYAQGA